MIPQVVAIFLHITAMYNCVKALSDDPDHKVKAEIAVILVSSFFFIVICVITFIAYSLNYWRPQGGIGTLWQVYSVFNALVYAIATKRLSECSMIPKSSTKLKR